MMGTLDGDRPESRAAGKPRLQRLVACLSACLLVSGVACQEATKANRKGEGLTKSHTQELPQTAVGADSPAARWDALRRLLESTSWASDSGDVEVRRAAIRDFASTAENEGVVIEALRTLPEPDVEYAALAAMYFRSDGLRDAMIHRASGECSPTVAGLLYTGLSAYPDAPAVAARERLATRLGGRLISLRGERQ